MLHRILAVAFVLLFAGAASAIDTTKYPSTITDSTCTDASDVPAAYTPGLTSIGGSSYGSVASATITQLSGSPDGYCDHDSRILKMTGAFALTEDTNFGPFTLAPGYTGYYLFVDAVVVHASTGDFIMFLGVKKPHDGAVFAALDSGTLQAGSADYVFAFGAPSLQNPTGETADPDAPIPQEFYVVYDERTATSFSGDISVVPFP